MEEYGEELVSENHRLIGVIPLTQHEGDMKYVDLAVEGLMAADDATPPFSLPLHFLSLRFGHQFPVPKRNSARWLFQDGSGVDDAVARSTRGILKTGWLQKHILEIPAVLLCILKLDLSVPQNVWSVKLKATVEKVKDMEQSLSPRGIRIVVLMVRQGTCEIEGVNVASLTEQRRMAFTRIMDDEAHVFTVSEEELAPSVSHQNTMKSIVQRLRDMVSAYYASEVEKIQRKEALLVPLLPKYKYLLVRVYIKLGVILEATGSKARAFQSMQNAFSLLSELMTSARDYDESPDGHGRSLGCSTWQGPAACWQIRAVAEVVYLRILRHFLLNQRDTASAIAFQHSYMASFGPNPRGLMKNDGPAYKIYAWMVQQHASFAEMLCGHVDHTNELLTKQNGLECTAEEEQKAEFGQYWYNSAVCALLRQAAATQSLGHQGERKILTIPSASLSILPPAFLGQEAEIVVKVDGSLVDPQQAWEVIEDVLNNREAEVDHAALSKQRINSTLMYCHSGRRRHTLLCWLAEVEAQSNDNEAACEHWRNALEGVDGFLEDGWGSLSKDALLGINRAAQQVNKWNYAAGALLMLGCKSMDKCLSDAECKYYLREAFLIGKRDSSVNVHVWPRSRGLGRFLLCCGRFECASACAGTVVQFRLYIRSTLVLPVVASSLLVRFQPLSHGFFNDIELKHKLGAVDPRARSAATHQKFEVDLTLVPGCPRIFSIPLLLDLPPNSQLHAREGKLLSLSSIHAALSLENDPDLQDCILHVTSEAMNEPWVDWRLCWGHFSMKALKPLSRAQISIKEAHPPLRGALNRMHVVINSNGDAITGGTLTVEAVPPPSGTIPRESLFWRPVDDTEAIFEPVLLGPDLQPMEALTIPDIEGGDLNGSVELSLWIRGIEEGEAGPIAVSLHLQYGGGSGSVGHTIQVSPTRPFDATTNIMVGARDVLDGNSNRYPFVVEAILRCIQDQPLQLLRVEYNDEGGGADSPRESLQDEVLYDCMESDQMEGGVRLNHNDTFNICLNAPRPTAVQSSLGSLWVYWIRSNDASHIATHSPTLGQTTLVAATEIKLPNLSDVEVPIPFTLTVPPIAKIGIAFNMCCKLYNTTGLHQDVRLLMTGGDEFVWSGTGERLLHLPPDEVTSVLHTLVPLRHGHLRLPVISLFWERMKQELSTPHLSEWIFITP